MTTENIFIVYKDSLVCQKDSRFERGLKTQHGEVDVFKDGCSLVSLYNALVISGYNERFEDSIEVLFSGGVITESHEIYWARLNEMNLPLKFVWMQDNERNGCDIVNIDLLKMHIDNYDLIPIIKLQSLYGPERRHYMIAVGANSEGVDCIESSHASGDIITRRIMNDEVLGVRYLCHEDELDKWGNVFETQLNEFAHHS